MQTLNKRQIALVLVHSSRRMLVNFKPHERTKHFELIAKRYTKFLKQTERKFIKDFVFATEFEKVFWKNVTDKYDKSTPVFGVHFVADLYDYYEAILKKHTMVSFKHIELMGKDYTGGEVERSEMRSIEDNNNDLLSTYVSMFEEYTGIGLKKNLFQGKKLLIKNNIITDGKEVRDGF